jgi:hypothetical protein
MSAPQELRVALIIADGVTVQEAATQLVLSPSKRISEGPIANLASATAPSSPDASHAMRLMQRSRPLDKRLCGDLDNDFLEDTCDRPVARSRSPRSRMRCSCPTRSRTVLCTCRPSSWCRERWNELRPGDLEREPCGRVDHAGAAGWRGPASRRHRAPRNVRGSAWHRCGAPRREIRTADEVGLLPEC